MLPPARPYAPSLVALALALSLAAAVSLGVTRFAYGLLLPPMRADLQWSYTLAGAMNTANALGYLLGALLTPALLRVFGTSRLLLAGAALASLFMGLSGFFTETVPLLLQRVLAGIASAFLFIAGSLLAARLVALQPHRGGWLLGLYYGGTGAGIVLSALLVPALLEAARERPHGWAWAWWGLALACLLATFVLAWPAHALQRMEQRAAAVEPNGAVAPQRFSWWRFAPGLTGYFMFGVGYIGYMTFVIALLRDQGEGPARITWFYALLGLAVVASSRIWAGLLDRFRGGEALAILSGLLAVATVIPAWTAAWPLVLLSGVLFGGVFLSVVASTTALVRHNLPPAEWAAGISAFTTVFAFGQIVGPTVVGWIADGPGGLARGLVFSAGALALGALLAWRQRPLAGDISAASRDNDSMKIWKWLALALGVLVLLLGAVAVALQQWVGSADFRGRVAREASAALGVPVVLGNISVDLWPLPAVALERVQVKSQPPLTLQRLEARPAWAPLLQGRLEVATLVVREAVVPEQAVAAIAAAFDKTQRAGKRDATGRTAGAPGLPRRTVLDEVTWVYAKGGSTTVDAQMRLDADGLPGSADVKVRRGRFQGARAAVTRGDGHWALRADIGGGTVQGKFQVQPAARGLRAVQAQLTTANVDITTLTERRTLTGRLDAQTTLRAELGGPGAIVDSVRSQTRFTVQQAVLHGIDLVQAVKSVGLNRSGETRIDTLAGILVTQGRSVQLNNLVASSGQLSATGNVAMAPNRSLSGRITVDLASRAAAGAIAVPLAVGGTLDSPTVMLTQGALLGAAIGTMIAPGVGTGAGASAGDRLGDKLRGLFGK